MWKAGYRALLFHSINFLMEYSKKKEKEEPGLGDHLEGLVDHAEDFARTYIKLAKAKATQKAANAASAIFNGVLLVVFAFFMMLFIGLGLAWWLGDVLNSRAGGFLLMAGIYLVLIGTIAALRKTLIYPFIRNIVVKKIYD